MHDCTCAKVDIWMPEDLIATVRAQSGAAKFDRYVVAAVSERLRLDLLDDVLAALEVEYGPIPTEIREQTAKAWPNYDVDRHHV